MPAAMTYDSLLEDLRRYLERGNVSDTQVYEQLPRLIGLTERDIATKLKILGFVNVVVDLMVAGTSVYLKPDRWRQTTSISIGVTPGATIDDFGTRVQLLPRGLEYSRRYWPNPNNRDEPRFYSDYDYYHWLIVPTPVVSYPWEIIYWELPALLDATNQTSWLTAYAPNALLYGTLLQCAPFLKNDERVPTWQGFYTDQLQSLDGQDLQRILDRTAVRQEV